eukprot:1159045-Pelagomonas_calceolata.AAC.13
MSRRLFATAEAAAVSVWRLTQPLTNMQPHGFAVPLRSNRATEKLWSNDTKQTRNLIAAQPQTQCQQQLCGGLALGLSHTQLPQPAPIIKTICFQKLPPASKFSPRGTCLDRDPMYRHLNPDALLAIEDKDP